ncbi:MAG: AsmA family protein, partial [Geminicoccaceae bacterium]
MKKLFLFIGALVILVVAVVIAAPFLIPTETIKSQLTAQVEAATGRKLAVDGDLDLSLIPNVAVQMSDVHFANAPGSDVQDMVSLDELKVVLKAMPLLSGAVEVSEFVLIEPNIHLEVDAEGTPNWEMQGSGGDAESTETTSEQGGGSLPITELKLGDIRLENGRLTFVDRAAGTEEKVEAINVKVSLDDIKSPLQMLGSLDYKGETIELDLGLNNPNAILQGDQSAFKLGVKADLLQLGFNGELKNQGAPSAAGDVDLSAPSLKKLLAWLAGPVDFAGEGLEQLTIAGKLNAAAERVAFTDATVSLDQIQGQGEVTAELAGAVPKIGGRLDLGAVDLNPYLPPPAESEDGTAEGDSGSAQGGDGGETAPASTDWSDEPIDMPPLDAVDLAFELTLDKLLVQELKLDRTVLALTMADNAVVANLKEFALYEGAGSGTLSLKVAGGRPTIEKKFTLTGLQALPFLTDAAEFDRLEGTATAEFGLTTTGGSERELVNNLNGDG